MRGDCIYINKKRTNHWLTGINTSARTHSGPLVVDSFNLSNIIADETDLGKLKKRQSNLLFYSNFNPRTREGCDSLQIGSVTICSLINHIAN